MDKLEATIQACASFNSENVHVDYFRTEDYTLDPICLIQLQRDSIESIGPAETQHMFIFMVRVKHAGTGTKANLNEIISYVDEIVAQVEADRNLGSNYVENTEIVNIEYSMESPPSAVIYHAIMTLEIMALRNI